MTHPVQWFIMFAILYQARTYESNNLTLSDSSKVLSRRKRFIIFAEGSSFQLVFCVTYPLVNPFGDIMLMGNTAALAFELPQDPYSPFNHRADPLHRRMDTKTIYYTDDHGKIIYKQPYVKRKPIVNPAFAKRSVDSNAHPFKNGTLNEFKIDRKAMHASKHGREFLKGEHMEASSVEFHRTSRFSLYQKIETLLQGLGGNGRECMLKTLCLVGQSQNYPQGEFLQELLRAVFTLPQTDEDDGWLQEYDEASKHDGSCEDLYPKCREHLSEVYSPTLNY